MKLNNILLYIFLLSVLSIFSPVTIYPLFFFIFIILFFLDILYKVAKQVPLPLYNVNIAIFSILFIFFASITFISHNDHSNITQFIKLILNLSFLVTATWYISDNFLLIYSERKKIQILFSSIIIMSFLQIITNVALLNLWNLPIDGIHNSMEAYKIIKSPIYFGSYEKNIWATKIVLIQIIYFSFIFFNFFRIRNAKVTFMFLISLFNIIYTFSRTAQLAYFAFIAAFILIYIYRKKNLLLKALVTYILLIVSIPTLYIVYKKLFHITLGSGDGMAARLDLWNSLWIALPDLNWTYGNGILYAKYIISEYTRWNNNNFHNVFLNTFADMGIVGLLVYCALLISVFYSKHLTKRLKIYIVFVLFSPLFIMINSQYLGYDSDIIIYFTFIYILKEYLYRKEGLT